MHLSIHPFYVKAAWVSLISSILNLLPFILHGEFSELTLRPTMVSLVFGLLISLLLSMGYNWMKWVVLFFLSLSSFSMLDLIVKSFSQTSTNLLSAIITILSTVADIIIVVMLFKIPVVTNKLQH